MTTIFLLAGTSSRMGKNKLLLPYKDKYIFEHTLSSALLLSERIIAVLGSDEERMREALSGYNEVEIRVNKDYMEGQKKSTLTGLEGVCDDVAILPGDLPLLKKEDWTEGLRYLSLCMPSRPLFNGLIGNPVFIPQRMIKGLESTSKPFKEYLEDEGIHYYDASIGCAFDVDTPARYEALINDDLSIPDSDADIP